MARLLVYFYIAMEVLLLYIIFKIPLHHIVSAIINRFTPLLRHLAGFFPNLNGIALDSSSPCYHTMKGPSIAGKFRKILVWLLVYVTTFIPVQVWMWWQGPRCWPAVRELWDSYDAVRAEVMPAKLGKDVIRWKGRKDREVLWKWRVEHCVRGPSCVVAEEEV